MRELQEGSPLQARFLAEANADYFRPCPSCRRYVTRVDAKSIFNSKIRICSRCALGEKALPDFNWVKDYEREFPEDFEVLKDD